MSITTAQICDAIEATLGTAASLSRSQSYNELTDAMNEWPTLQVYWNSAEQDISSANADRTTFGAAVRHTEIVINADYYARPRGHLAQDMEAATTGLDELIDILETQDTKPFFSLVGIQAFRWRADRAIFNYGSKDFMGVRFVITVQVF